MVVRVLAKNNNVFSTTTYEGVTYKAPSIFSRLGVALIAAPIFLVGIVVIILGVVGFSDVQLLPPEIHDRHAGAAGTAGWRHGRRWEGGRLEPACVR